MTWPEGVDAAWGRPTPEQLVAARKQFIIGYVSRDPAKNLTAHECTAYLAAGVAVGLVWETTARRALDGAAAGKVDGTEARRQARALAFPDDHPIFTAVDFQASSAELAGPVHNYLAAFAGAAGGTARAGVYGGLATVAYALDHRLVGVGWQTYAWSNGRWDPRATVQQYRNGVAIAGHDTDLDRAADLAAFWTPQGSTDMSLVPSDAHMVWAGSLEIPNMEDRSKPNVTPATALAQTWDAAVVIPPHVDSTVAAAVTAINAHTDAAVASITVPGGSLTPADLDAIRGVFREELAKLSINLAP